MTSRRGAVALAASGLAGLAGCTLLQRHTPVKMDVLYDDRACARTIAPVLLVLLPGQQMAPVELQQQGFIEAVRKRGLGVDVAAADANMNYVYDGSMQEHLHDDVIAPAREHGYRHIWLAGISLGGFVALAYAMNNPGEIDGVVALAPYLGRPPLIQAIAAAGGPAAWLRSRLSGADAEIESQVWRWLAAPPPGVPPIWLGYGSDDRFAPAHRLLTGLLPADHVDVVPGDHDWPPWRRLWSQWLDRGLLPKNCA